MIVVRNYRPDDADKICEYKGRSIKINFPRTEFNEEVFRANLLRYGKICPHCIKLVEVDGAIAGYVWFKVLNSAVGVFGRIEHIFVDDRYRGRGIGKKLMQAAHEYFKSRGVKKIKLTVTRDNKAALALYESLGYKTKRFIMEKDL